MTAQRPRPRLSGDTILASAVALADTEGLGAVTMRALARRLGVEAMSLYHHLAGKEQLLDGMVDLVVAEIDLPREHGDWRPELRRRCVSGRHVLTRHAWAVALMGTRASSGPNILRHHDAVIGCLQAGGFAPELAAHAVAVLDAHLYGSLIQQPAGPASGRTEPTVPATGLGASPHPELAEALPPGSSSGAEFSYGLDLILDGLEQRRARQPAARADLPASQAALAPPQAPGTFLWGPAPS